jgi:hypothetical protein
MTRRPKLFVLGITLLMIGASVLLSRRSNQSALTQSEPAIIQSEPLPSATPVEKPGEVVTKRGVHMSHNRAKPQPTPGMIDEREKKIIDESLVKIETKLKVFEKVNSAIVYDRNFPISHITIIKITPPSADQMAEIYADLSKSLEYLPKNSAIEQVLRSRGTRLINDYISFPKEMKMLRILSRNDGSYDSLTEHYVNDEALVMQGEDGGYNVPLPMHIDEHLSDSGSWAAKRYSHLIAVNKDP